ncbi:MAG: ATP-binding protein [Burkholderiales bacterium]|jgi:hypothetical protein|nr:ATP-binding protein [Burkholderiales bacterium]
MLLEFRTSNFRSFKDEQVLSLVANSDDSLIKNTTPTNIKAIPSVVNAALVYGANASGKSNWLQAFSAMINMVLHSNALAYGVGIPFFAPFFDEEHQNMPCEFEVDVLIGGNRYQYGFAITQQYVDREWLLFYPAGKGKAQEWFDRQYNNKDTNVLKHYAFGSQLKGRKASIVDGVQPNQLFLAKAGNLEQIQPLLNWFNHDVKGLNPTNDTQTIPSLLSNQIEQSDLLEFIQLADPNISDIELKPVLVKNAGLEFHFDGAKFTSKEVPEKEEEQYVPWFIYKHENGGKSARLPFDHLSAGTQRLFGIYAHFIDVVKQGKLMVVDELDERLHPNLVRSLIRLFQNSQTGAQLICTVHDTNLLDTNLIRRDQVWFVQKRADHSSYLYPLTDYSPRKTERLDIGYLTGRYGALPFLDEDN